MQLKDLAGHPFVFSMTYNKLVNELFNRCCSILDRTSTLMLKHLIYSVHTGIAHPHLYAEAFNIAIMGCSVTRPMGCSVIVDELWHAYRKIGRRRASQDVPANARRRPGHGFVDELWHTSKSGDAAHPRMSPLMHDAATGMVLHELSLINVYT